MVLAIIFTIHRQKRRASVSSFNGTLSQDSDKNEMEFASVKEERLTSCHNQVQDYQIQQAFQLEQRENSYRHQLQEYQLQDDYVQNAPQLQYHYYPQEVYYETVSYPQDQSSHYFSAPAISQDRTSMYSNGRSFSAPNIYYDQAYSDIHQSDYSYSIQPSFVVAPLQINMDSHKVHMERLSRQQSGYVQPPAVYYTSETSSSRKASLESNPSLYTQGVHQSLDKVQTPSNGSLVSELTKNTAPPHTPNLDMEFEVGSTMQQTSRSMNATSISETSEFAYGIMDRVFVESDDGNVADPRMTILTFDS
jgi:hypothetical protein